MSILFVLVFTLSAKGEVKVLNTARCIFGSVVMAAQKAGIKVKMNGNCAGLNKGIKAVSRGTVDVGTLSRNLTDEEIQEGLLVTTLTYDGMAVLVNKESPINNLTSKQILATFAFPYQLVTTFVHNNFSGSRFRIVLRTH